MSYLVVSQESPLEVFCVTETAAGRRVTPMSLRDAARVAAFAGADLEVVVCDGADVVELALVTDDLGDVDFAGAAPASGPEAALTFGEGVAGDDDWSSIAAAAAAAALDDTDCVEVDLGALADVTLAER